MQLSIKCTGRLVELCGDVHNRPAMSGIDSRVGAAFVYRGQVVPMLFALRAPRCGRLLENAVISDPGYMRINVTPGELDGRTETVAA